MNTTRIPLLLPHARDLMFRVPPHLFSAPRVMVGSGIGDGVGPHGALDVGEGGILDVGGPAFLEERNGYFGEGFALGLDYDGAEDVVAVFEVCAGEVVDAGCSWRLSVGLNRGSIGDTLDDSAGTLGECDCLDLGVLGKGVFELDVDLQWSVQLGREKVRIHLRR